MSASGQILIVTLSSLRTLQTDSIGAPDSRGPPVVVRPSSVGMVCCCGRPIVVGLSGLVSSASSVTCLVGVCLVGGCQLRPESWPLDFALPFAFALAALLHGKVVACLFAWLHKSSSSKR